MSPRIHALSNVENEYFRLIFAGGTCLAKAHRIVNGMSEDIDFKIQLKNHTSNLSKNRRLKELKLFRELINQKLIIPDLTSNSSKVRNEGQYSEIEISYPHAFEQNSNLRPGILLELTQSDIRLSTEDFVIKTLIDVTFPNTTSLTSLPTTCISINETAIEKWVGLTRRVILIERGRHSKDETIIRHLYDLNYIKHANKINENFFELARDTVINDGQQYKNQHPEYTIDPITEIQQSLEILRYNPIWKEYYLKFTQD